MKELRTGKLQTRLAGLLNLQSIPINLTQCEKNNPSQITLHTRLLGDCFSQINRKPKRHSWPVLSLALPFLERRPGFLIYRHKGTSCIHAAFSLSLQKRSALCPPPHSQG